MTFAMNGYLPLHFRASFASAKTRVLIPCFSYRANVVIGDIYLSGAQATVEAIKKLPPGSGEACWKRCDVINWEEQVALFEYAVTKFGGVDIVVSGYLFDA
jgi:NAD(P)-dependent dehydrogenase (short-subunit alcohol dehydrogenase family)